MNIHLTMANQDKLVKSLESLRILIMSTQTSDLTVRKKEKISHCTVISEIMCSSNTKSSSNLPNLISFSLEILLQLCDDSESDVRMVADESLNRIIRVMADGYVGKILVELHKEIKKNSSSRSLRVALLHFSHLCHMIKPHKGKLFVQNLVPCLIKIAEREEEAVHETLAECLVKIMTSLGSFTSDNDVKALLKVFLQNLSNNSPVIRRSAANSILTITKNSRKPHIFISYILCTLLDFVIPVRYDLSISLILGVFSCLRTILPTIKKDSFDLPIQESWEVRKSSYGYPLTIDRMIQVYELSLYYTSHTDHNVINAALETLHIFLDSCDENMIEILTSSSGITRRRILQSENLKLTGRSLSELSVATTATNMDDNFLDSEKSLAPDVEQWIESSTLSHEEMNENLPTSDDKLSLNNYFEEQNELSNEESIENKLNQCEYSNMYIGAVNLNDDDIDICDIPKEPMQIQKISREQSPKQGSSEDLLESLSVMSSFDDKNDYCRKEVDIGDYNDVNIPLIYCCRHLAKSFLLTGIPNNLIPDKIIRVSVKSLALTCISSIVNIYPNIFSLYLNKSHNPSAKEVDAKDEIHCLEQRISDILLFADHADPQLRGIVRILIGSLINSVLIHTDFNYNKWLIDNGIDTTSKSEVLNLDHLICLITKGLEDDSSTCSRQSLIGLETCFLKLCESYECQSIKEILNVLPLLVKNPYWLVKVKLVEVVQTLPFTSIHHITGNNEFQDKIIFNVLFLLLKDDDKRVRSASAVAIGKIIPHLYYKIDISYQLPAVSKALFEKNKYLIDLLNINCDDNTSQYFLLNMPDPFCTLGSDVYSVRIQKSLSKVVDYLSVGLLKSSLKYYIYGCSETLSLLSSLYRPTTYFISWDCASQVKSSQTFDEPSQAENVGQSSGLFTTCVSLLCTSTTTLDLSCQQWLLHLAGNLFSGLSIQHLHSCGNIQLEKKTNSYLWDIYTDRTLSHSFEEFLQHIMKLLSIFYHIIEESTPTVIPSKPVLSNLPNASTLSPMKRKTKTDSDRNKITSPVKVSLDKEDKTDRKNEIVRINSMGYFASTPHYIKLYEVLKTAYNNYKITVDVSASEKFLYLLKTTLKTLAQILEMSSLQEIGRVAEEILLYLQSCMNLEPATTVLCVQQLLKCLFGTNMCCQLNELNIRDNLEKGKNEIHKNSFYESVFQSTYLKLTNCFDVINMNNKIKRNDDSIVMGYLRRKGDRKQASFKSLTRGADKTSLANYIRLFEPMVIKSLKQYTMTSDVDLQCKVLQLLSQLVQLRVNYCLLDSDQIFIGFVLTQFEFIEQGQIRNCETLIPKIFYFLVNLSYEKQHSKSIIGIPKIINLCDGLMASGQSPITHCIPALKPVIEDIFLARCASTSSGSEIKELETTRDVLFSMLLRLVEYHQVIEMITLIINENRYNNDNGEKWTKLSKSVVDVLFTKLAQRRMRLETKESQIALQTLFTVLDPDVFKPIDVLLNILFHDPPTYHSSKVDVIRWMGSIIAIFFQISQIKEDQFLARINNIKSNIKFNSIFNMETENIDPLNVSSCENVIEDIPPEVIFSYFIFRVIDTTSDKCFNVFQKTKADTEYIVEQLSIFLLFCLYIFQSGTHCKIANTSMTLINQVTNTAKYGEPIPIEKINKTFSKLSFFAPLLTFKWCYILTLLNYSHQEFWSNILQTIKNVNIIHLSPEKFPKYNLCCSINLEIVRIGGIILYSDYLCENIKDGEKLTWFIVNHIESIVRLSNELPVMELISAIHRNSISSGLFIQAIASRCQHLVSPSFVIKLLKCLEEVHPTQSGALLLLLIPKYLSCKQLALSRLAAGLASRRIEMLLTMTIMEVSNQISKDDLVIIMEILLETKLAKKNGTMVSLLNKLASSYYDLSPLVLDQGRTVKPENVKNILVNKSWFLSQVKVRCCQSNYLGNDLAQLLSKLEYEDIIFVMSQKEFNKLIFKDCIKYAYSVSLQSADYSFRVEETSLMRATVDSLLKNVGYLKSSLPKPHQVYDVDDRISTPFEIKYTNRLNELLSDNIFWDTLCHISPAVTCYLEILPCFSNIKINETTLEDLCKFGVLCLESVVHVLNSTDDFYDEIQINFIDIALNCASSIFKKSQISNIMSLDSHSTWLCSSINAVYKLIKYLLHNNEALPTLLNVGLKQSLENSETRSPANACQQIAVLIAWLEKKQKNVSTPDNSNIPEFLMKSIKSIIISLSRLPLVNSYVMTPPDVWKQRWEMNLTGQFYTKVPPLPVEFLQDIDTLEQFIFRVTLIGWTSRQQFEETWMCLLSVLSSYTIDNCLPEDLPVVAQANSLVVQAFTTLLLQTLLIPVPGNPNVSKFLHVPRDKNINNSSSSVQKLKNIQSILYWKYKQNIPECELNLQNIFDRPNLERLRSYEYYGYGQLSVEYLWGATKISEQDENNKSTILLMEHKKCLEDSELDVHSCLYFLLDLYSQWIKSQSATPLCLLNEVIKSVIAISDLFTEKSQFQWMMDVCLELSKNHPIEDEILHQYLVIGLAKSAAVIIPDIETYEEVKRVVETSLKRGFLPARISSLHGILYLLQSSVMSNTVIGGSSDEMLLIQPMAVDYIQHHITVNNGTSSEDHQLIMWALAFYLLENEEKITETELIPSVLQTVLTLLSQNNLQIIPYNVLIQGVERLVVSKSLAGRVIDQIIKLALGKLKHTNPNYALPALQLLLACMYTEAEEQLSSNNGKNDPELLVQAIEKTSAIFDRIKKGYPFEAELLCSILPNLLTDFFPPSEILTKVIGEFLSSQQPHPKLLSGVVFQVFERACEQSQLALLQDWVVFSLSNFTQCLPIGMATWCLTCFFVSASTNKWLRSLFPYIQSRIGKYEYEDKKLVCISGKDFYNQLSSDTQKKKFIETFEKVVDQPGTPFKDLINSL